MMRRFAFLFCFLVGCAQVARAQERSPLCDAPILSIAGSGQSNMSARNTDTPPAIDAAIALRLMQFGNDWTYHQAEEPLDSQLNQVDTLSRDALAAVGPLMYAGERLAEVLTATIVLVPCPLGGTAANVWKPLPDGAPSPPLTVYRRNQLYGSCLARTQHVATAYRAKLAFTFHAQGESDALPSTKWPKTETEARMWRPFTLAQAEAWRADMGNPDLLFVYTQLPVSAPSASYTWWAVIREEQELLSSASELMVPTSQNGSPHLHFTAVEQKVIGRDAADAWLAASGCF